MRSFVYNITSRGVKYILQQLMGMGRGLTAASAVSGGAERDARRPANRAFRRSVRHKLAVIGHENKKLLQPVSKLEYMFELDLILPGASPTLPAQPVQPSEFPFWRTEMSTLSILSTDGVPIGESRDYWRTTAAEIVGRLEVDVRPESRFHGCLCHANIGDLVLGKLCTGPHRVTRTATFARQYDRGYIKAVLHTRGSSLLNQDDRTTTIGPGEWSLYDTARPYRLTILEESEMLILLLPRERLYTPQSSLQRITVRQFSGRVGMGKLASQLVSTTFEEIGTLSSSECFDVADSIAQMIRLAALNTTPEPVSQLSRDMLRERIKSFVTIHLRNPNLSIDHVASAVRCTKRYLHKVFEEEELSISEYILRKRLERCRETLMNPECMSQSVTDIAYSWGFSNSNHFSRCFKEAFGVPPSAIRTQTQQKYVA